MKNLVTIVLSSTVAVFVFWAVDVNNILTPEPTPEPTPEQIEKQEIDRVQKETNRLGFKTIVYDDCEYVFFASYHNSGLAHKGNCKNPQHQKGKIYEP